jgi:PPK2 family polyphosphate:nucleotide phosphotransferase
MPALDQYRIQPGQAVRLANIDPDDTGPFTGKKESQNTLKSNVKRLAELQRVLWAESRHALLVILQAIDAGGKDGTIRHVMSGVNPQGVRVTSFKQPTEEELAHDYLWRIHQAVPRRGMIGIFNRSHYEDVLVVRVHDLVPAEVWQTRYEHINNFERHLAENGVTIVKFYLHISKDEQKKRFQARLDRPDKRWKFNPGDLKDRALWKNYRAAFEDALSKCSTAWAPWHVVPANNKWYRNLVVSDILVQTLERLEMKYPEPPPGLDDIQIPD